MKAPEVRPFQLMQNGRGVFIHAEREHRGILRAGGLEEALAEALAAQIFMNDQINHAGGADAGLADFELDGNGCYLADDLHRAPFHDPTRNVRLACERVFDEVPPPEDGFAPARVVRVYDA